MLHERCIFVKDIKKHYQMATRLGREVATPSIFQENLSRYRKKKTMFGSIPEVFGCWVEFCCGVNESEH